MTESPYKIKVSEDANLQALSKHTWIVILHASRIPPHVGLLIDGSYNSLTIKGHELNVRLEVLLKTIQQKKLETLFIQLKKHPVFSAQYQLEIFQHHIQQFTQVNDEATCLSPVKLYLQEFYIIPLQETELFFELVERLKQNQYIHHTIGLNIGGKLKDDEFELPIYSSEQLQTVIQTERANFYKK
jgi:hypothetical protein